MSGRRTVFLVVLILVFSFASLDATARKKAKKKRDQAPQETEQSEVMDFTPSPEEPAPESEPPAVEAHAGQTLEGEVPVDLDAEGEEAVDLDSLEEDEPAAPPPSGHPGPGQGGMKPPKFKLFFDLLTEYEFETETFQFTRDHAHVVLELSAMDWLSFRTDIALEPEFFELIFHMGTSAELRMGKILVPFGQNEFHHLIGGRVDEQSLFLPVVWGDYGLSFKHFLYDGEVLSLDYSIWAVNGFQAVTAPGEEGEPVPVEPRREAGSLTDNNLMKGLGIRPTIGLGRAFRVGTSWYLDSWDEEMKYYMTVYGADVDLGYGLMPVAFFRDLRLRFEIAWAEIMMPDQNPYKGVLAAFGVRRAGYNAELNYRILPWLVLRFRHGRLNDNNRVTDANDLMIYEPGFVASFGPVQFYLLLQLHQTLAEEPDEESTEEQDPESVQTEFSKIYMRVLFRY